MGNRNIITVFCFCLLLVVPAVAAADALPVRREGVRATVAADDCAKCHDEVVRLLKRKGLAHAPLCLECHQGHPPADMEIVPACSTCHQGSAHFNLAGCLDCHRDPHAPREIFLTRDMTAPCLTCHQEQIKQLRDNPSMHSRFHCTACHWHHGQLQPCGNCHLPHSDAMKADSCVKCHSPHMPLVIRYGENTPSEECGSCHRDVYATLGKTWGRHRNVSCVRCHAGQHGMIPACQDCHENPHPGEIREKFSGCGDCHAAAHDLWGTKASTSKFVRERE
ncbi:MAG: cytochrome c3 family protein [Thermodesulfobacteriota bacterium]